MNALSTEASGARRLSVLVPTDRPLDDVVATARRIEAAGLGGMWVPDHLSGGSHFRPPWRAAFPTLATVLAATVSLRCGTLVASPALRPAPLLGLETRTLDEAYPERCRWAVGGGADSDSVRTGLSRLDADALDAYLESAALAGPPIIAGNVAASVHLAARRGGGWVTTTGLGRVGAAKAARFDELLALYRAHGGSGPVLVLVEPGEESPWRSPDALVETCASWRARGADEIVAFRPDVYATNARCDYAEAAEALAHL